MIKVNKQRVYAGLVAGLVIIGLSAGFYMKTAAKPANAEEVLYVRTNTIGASGAGQSYTYSGEVRGRYESELAFQVGGKIVKRNVELGSVVRPGDVLMKIDAKDLRQTVNSNSAAVDSAQAQLKLAENNLERYQKLYESHAISRAQLDQYQAAYEAAAAAARQASAQYSQGVNQLDYSLLVADKPGVISSITAEAGQVVEAGQTVITLVQDGEKEIEINVPENRLTELQNAKTIEVSFWALPNVRIEGRVREIAPMADKVTRTYKVRLSLVNPPPEVKLGMTAAVQVAGTGSQSAAIYVPLTAIYQNGQEPAVWLVQEGVVSLRPIKVGVFGSDSVEVLQGLKTGDVIVTAGVHRLREGQKVRTTGDSL